MYKNADNSYCTFSGLIALLASTARTLKIGHKPSFPEIGKTKEPKTGANWEMFEWEKKIWEMTSRTRREGGPFHNPKPNSQNPYSDGFHTSPPGAMLIAQAILTGLNYPALVNRLRPVLKPLNSIPRIDPEIAFDKRGPKASCRFGSSFIFQVGQGYTDPLARPSRLPLSNNPSQV